MAKHPPKVMVWGCFSWRGRLGLEFLKIGEMMNGLRYCQLLDEKLEFFMSQHGTSCFLQDGAPCHRSKIVTTWFQQRPHIKLVKLPRNSPDLNPIIDSLVLDKEEPGGPQMHQHGAVEGCHQDGVAGEDRAVKLPPEAGRLPAQDDAGGH